jgi:hypothetical protein
MLARLAFRGLPYFDHLGDHSIGGLKDGCPSGEHLGQHEPCVRRGPPHSPRIPLPATLVRTPARAAATAHAARHAPHAATYAVTAARRAAVSAHAADATAEEGDRQFWISSPEHLRAVVFPDRGAS